MIFAPSRVAALRLAMLVALFVPAGACNESAGGRTAARKGPRPVDEAMMDSAGPVVIATPKDRYAGGTVATPGAVTGTVTLKAPLTIATPVSTGKDSAVCGRAIPDSSAQQKGAGLGNVVVWLDGVRKGKAIPLEKRIELESDRCILTPRMQAAVVGTAVNVIGHDDFRQHLHFIAGGEERARVLVLMGKDEQVIPTELVAKSPGLVTVRDADHPWPRAFVAVFDHPYYAVTKPDGSFTIDGVPAGTYTLVAWHERTGKSEQKVTVAPGAAAKVGLTLSGR